MLLLQIDGAGVDPATIIYALAAAIVAMAGFIVKALHKITLFFIGAWAELKEMHNELKNELRSIRDINSKEIRESTEKILEKHEKAHDKHIKIMSLQLENIRHAKETKYSVQKLNRVVKCQYEDPEKGIDNEID
jgi:polyhydroxyalkanoate synthesis regulator phasin